MAIDEIADFGNGVGALGLKVQKIAGEFLPIETGLGDFGDPFEDIEPRLAPEVGLDLAFFVGEDFELLGIGGRLGFVGTGLGGRSGTTGLRTGRRCCRSCGRGSGLAVGLPGDGYSGGELPTECAESTPSSKIFLSICQLQKGDGQD